MDQINKTDINDMFAKKNQINFSVSCVYLDYEIFVMQDLFNDFLYPQKWLLGWADFVETELVSISKKFTMVLNNTCLVILSSQSKMLLPFLLIKSW